MSGYARHRDAMRFQKRLNSPVMIRDSRTPGGSGGNFAYGADDFRELVQRGLGISPVHEVRIEESVLGQKEFELEVMRDYRDNVVIICSELEPLSLDGKIEAFTILYISPVGHLKPLAWALIGNRCGQLFMAQGEDFNHLKIGREVYLRKVNETLFLSVRRVVSERSDKLFKEV